MLIINKKIILTIIIIIKFSQCFVILFKNLLFRSARLKIICSFSIFFYGVWNFQAHLLWLTVKAYACSCFLALMSYSKTKREHERRYYLFLPIYNVINAVH